MSIRKEAETERQKLKNMSTKDRAWYIWEYYKFHILALILAAAALWTLGGMLYRQTFTTRLSIAIVNDQAGGASSTAGLEAGLKMCIRDSHHFLIEDIVLSVFLIIISSYYHLNIGVFFVHHLDTADCNQHIFCHPSSSFHYA